ncbi:MAG: hypothetical protein HC793_01820 [Aquincola sp.]|nr:hypothetical protein [Aquincola sp.]
MAHILFLAHRYPYPPNKGDKITTWNILEHLSARHRIHLAAFIDDPADWQHEAFLKSRFASLKLCGIDRRTGLLRSVTGLATGEALSVAYYRDAGMQAWVDATLNSPTVTRPSNSTGKKISAPGILALCYAGYGFAAFSWMIGEHSSNSPNGPPLYHFKSLIPLVGGFMILQGLAEVVRCVQCLQTGAWPERLHDVEETEKLILEQAEAAQKGAN